jgi:hypothetical protein
MLIGPRERLGYRTWYVRLSESPRLAWKGQTMISREEFVFGSVLGVLFWVACQAVGLSFERFEERGVGHQSAHTPALLESSLAKLSLH